MYVKAHVLDLFNYLATFLKIFLLFFEEYQERWLRSMGFLNMVPIEVYQVTMVTPNFDSRRNGGKTVSRLIKSFKQFRPLDLSK
jgi:hypothetical protein